MKKKITYTTIAALAAAAIVPAVTTVTTEAAENTVPGGFYFTSTTGTGVFYNFDDWTDVDGNTKVELFEEYGLENVYIYLDAMNEIANLGQLDTDGVNFAEGSSEYKVGDLSGDYKDGVTGDIITPAPIVELTVDSVMATDATTLSVTLSDETTHEVTLEEALEANVAKEVTFEIDGKEYTATVTWEVEEVELTVESVSAINTTGVTVEVTELTADIEGATIEVKNSKGNVVEVEAADFSAGETTLDFAFVTEVKEEDLTGVWTVDGVEFNLGLTLQLTKFEETNSQLELYALLEELNIENLDSALAFEYLDGKAEFLSDLAADEKELTVAAIQAYVNQVNADSVTEEQKEAAVDAVLKALKAENNIQLKAALANTAFTKVNNAWIEATNTNDGYAAELALETEIVKYLAGDPHTADVDNVQDVINSVNEDNITAAHVAADTDSTKLKAVSTLISTYAAVDADGEYSAEIDEIVDAIEEQLAFNDVLAATVASKFKSTVTTLAGVVAEGTIDLDDYKDANGKAYIDAIKVVNNTTRDEARYGFGFAPMEKVDDADAIQKLILAVNAEKVAANATKLFTEFKDAYTPLLSSSNATAKAKFTKAADALGLKRVATTSAHITAYKNDTAIADAIGTVLPSSPGQAETAVASIQAKINTANVAVVNGALEKDVIEALNVLELKNVIAANAKAYATQITAAADHAAVQKAVDAVNKTVAIEEAVTALNKATTATEAKDALDTLSNNGKIAGYLNVTSVDRIFIAEKVLADRDELKVDRVLNAKAKQFISEVEVTTSVNKAITKRTEALTAINALTSELDSAEVETITVDTVVVNAEEQVETAPIKTSITAVELVIPKVVGEKTNVTATVKHKGTTIETVEIASIANDAEAVTVTLAAPYNLVTSEYLATDITVELTYGTDDVITVNTATPTTSSIPAVEETQVTGFTVTATAEDAVTGATLKVYKDSVDGTLVKTQTVDLTGEEDEFTIELDSNQADGTYVAVITYDAIVDADNDLLAIANALLLVGHDSLSGAKTATAADTAIAEKFFNKLTFGEDPNTVSPKFTSISSIRTVLDGLQ